MTTSMELIRITVYHSLRFTKIHWWIYFYLVIFIAILRGTSRRILLLFVILLRMLFMHYCTWIVAVIQRVIRLSAYVAILVKRIIKEILLRFLNFTIVWLASAHVIWEDSIWALSHGRIGTIIEQFILSCWELFIWLLNNRRIFATDPADFRRSIPISPSARRLRNLISRWALLNISFVFIVIIAWLWYRLFALR